MYSLALAFSIILLVGSSISATASGHSLLYEPPMPVARQRISLSSLNVPWTLRRVDGEIAVPGTVPGDVYSDLQLAGVIQDPVTENNDVKTRWIANYNWTYEAKFHVNKTAFIGAAVDLVMEGVDTVGTVSINGVPVLHCDNFWRVYRVDVTSLLTSGVNWISVHLASPVKYAKRAAERYAARYGYKVPPDCPPDTFNGECHFNFIRKPAYSFSWDWGPAVPTSGIWRPIHLDVYSVLAIDYVKFSAHPWPGVANSWRAAVTVGIKFSAVTAAWQSPSTACIVAHIDGAGVEPMKRCFQLPPATKRSKLDNFTAGVTFEVITAPMLWWPNGLGRQDLYTLRVVLCADGPDCRLTSSESRRVAFRTIQLRQIPVGTQLSDGLTFEFVVNGRSIFIKGANFVPIGMAVASTGAVADYNWLITSAASSGINMLRVWGGGTIERPEFYDLADQMGILVWQDFMFACSLYPTDPAFLATVESEVRSTVRRLQHHASVAAWVTNNENEGALANRWWPLGADRSRLYNDYRRLYMRTVRPMALAEDATRPVLLSSPTNGDATEWQGGIATQPQSNRFGDVHFYSYTDDMWLTETIPLTRFMSEFGFQSHPSLVTVLSATTDPWNVGVGTNFTLHREHQTNGTQYIASHNGRHFQLETPAWLDGVNYAAIERMLKNYSVPEPQMKQLTSQLNTYAYLSYVSQIDQAEIYRRVTHLHAINRCRLNASSMEGLSAGAMFWQLNDVWSAPTWSTIERSGAWKAAQHYVRRYYANRRVAMLKTSDGLVSAVYIDDSPDASSGRSVAVGFTCLDVNSLARLQSWMVLVNQTSPSNKCPTEMFRIQEGDLVRQCKCVSANNCFLEAAIVDPTQGTRVLGTYSEHYFFDFPKYFNRVRIPQLTVNVTKSTREAEFNIQLTTVTSLYSVHLQFVCQSLARALLSDNSFHMTDRSRSLTLTVPTKAYSAEDVANCLLVHYL